jgi:hypothetical protein
MRISVVMAALVVLLTLWLQHRRSQSLVRIGGISNACACTQRIEP